jgi:cysteine desulfurase
MLPYFHESFGNPSAVTHSYGVKASLKINSCKEKLEDLLGCERSALIFTGGATEANNIVFLGINGNERKRNEIIISPLEHASVSNPARHLEKYGFRVKTLKVDPSGVVDVDHLKEIISDKTFLVSVMAVNHEIGTMQPITELASCAHEYGALFHSDATQAIGRVPLNIKESNVDFLSLSSHKFYGPPGVGLLYIKPDCKKFLSEAYFGGGQQFLRSGTIPLALVAGLTKACELAYEHMHAETQRLNELSSLLLNMMREEGVNFEVNGCMDRRACGSLNLRFDNISAEEMLLDLSDKISASTSSACSSKSKKPSPVLKAIGLTDEQIDSSIRLSFGRFTMKEDVINAANIIIQYIKNVSGEMDVNYAHSR